MQVDSVLPYAKTEQSDTSEPQGDFRARTPCGTKYVMIGGRKDNVVLSDSVKERIFFVGKQLSRAYDELPGRADGMVCQRMVCFCKMKELTRYTSRGSGYDSMACLARPAL